MGRKNKDCRKVTQPFRKKSKGNIKNLKQFRNLFTRLKQEDDLNNLQATESDSSSGIDNFMVRISSTADVLKSEGTDIDIKEYDVPDFVENKYESNCDNINRNHNLRLVSYIHETAAIQLNSNTHNSQVVEQISSVQTPAVNTPQAIQQRWESIINDASKQNKNVVSATKSIINIVSKQKSPHVSATTATQKITTQAAGNSHSKGVNTKERTKIIPISTELCVLCAKDISQLRTKKLITKFSGLVLILTSIDVTRYPIETNACGVCYKELMSIKGFQRKILAADALIKQKLLHLSESTVEINSESKNVIDIQLSAMSNESVTIIKDESENVQGNGNSLITGLTQKVSETAANLISMKDGTNETEEGGFNNGIISISELNESNIDDGMNLDTSEDYFLDDVPLSLQQKKAKPRRKTACPVCGKLFKIQYYKKHMRTHTKESMACNICDKLLRIGSMKEHMRYFHSQNKSQDKFMCQHCGKAYTKVCSLRVHQVTHGEKKFTCRICNRSFHFHNYLKRHMRSHSGERPYACLYCEKTFTIVWNLHQHQRLHTNSKPYKCPVCSTAFRHNVTLKTHLALAHTANIIAANIPSYNTDADILESIESEQHKIEEKICNSNI